MKNFIPVTLFFQIVKSDSDPDSADWKSLQSFEINYDAKPYLKTLQDKLLLIECEISDSLSCLRWRCEKYQEHKSSQFGQNDENVDFHYLCSNWISINQFLVDLFFPAIKPDAIDLSLCNHKKTGSETLKVFDDVVVMKYTKDTTEPKLNEFQYNWYALKKWKELIENELPESVNLLNVTKFCTTETFLFLETSTPPAPVTKPPMSVLIVGNKSSPKNPLVATFDGTVDRNLRLPRIDADGTCGAMMNGVYWFIGGYQSNEIYNHDFKIHRINDCEIELFQTMDATYSHGACGTFDFPKPGHAENVQKILFCFNWNDSKNCQTFDGTNVVSASATNFDHDRIFYMGAYRNRPFIVGSSSGDGQQKTEIMEMESGQWRIDSTDYTLQSRIYAYSVASSSSAAYIIGGEPDRNSISKFENNAWSIVGTLLHKRAVHASIVYNGEIFIAGGESATYADQSVCVDACVDACKDECELTCKDVSEDGHVGTSCMDNCADDCRLPCRRTCRNAPAPLPTEILNLQTNEQREIDPEFCGKECYMCGSECSYENYYYHPILLLVQNGFCSRS